MLGGKVAGWGSAEGSVAAFRRCYKVEVLGRLAGHEPGRIMRDAFSRGVARGLAGGELLHDMFGARTLALTAEAASEMPTRHPAGNTTPSSNPQTSSVRGLRAANSGSSRPHTA